MKVRKGLKTSYKKAHSKYAFESLRKKKWLWVGIEWRFFFNIFTAVFFLSLKLFTNKLFTHQLTLNSTIKMSDNSLYKIFFTNKNVTKNDIWQPVDDPPIPINY